MLATLCAILLAGEPVRFDAREQPQFSAAQSRATADATRAGLARWAATEHGRALIRLFATDDVSVEIVEDRSEEGVGRAPEPGIATMVAAGDRHAAKAYRVILNPTVGATPGWIVPGYPATAADMMAVACAAELLHVSFYARGIQLPHHDRDDFQREWSAIAAELGFPRLHHGD